LAQTPWQKKNTVRMQLSPALSKGVREAVLITTWAFALYLLVALATYTATDPGWSHSGFGGGVANKGGIVGAWIADILCSLFGYLAYVFPLPLAYAGWVCYRWPSQLEQPLALRAHWPELLLRGGGWLLIFAMGCGLAGLYLNPDPALLPMGGGGVIGKITSGIVTAEFGRLGATVLMMALLLVGISLLTGLSWLRLLDRLGIGAMACSGYLQRGYQYGLTQWRLRQALRRQAAPKVEPAPMRVVAKPRPMPAARPTTETTMPAPMASAPMPSKHSSPNLIKGDGVLPPIELLDEVKPSGRAYSEEALTAMSRLLEIKLRDFGVEVEVVAVHPGPVITRFELQPAPGVKVSQISNLSKDLARALSTVSVRVVEIIPGKTVVGLEIPNEQREMVYLREMFQSDAYTQSSSPLTLALGKDISGQPQVADLARMPHLLVAGTTGSGKSVAINAMLLSLLYKSTPREVRLILIDPKMLELSVYAGIPHLLAPVVTDMKEAANALRWCVAEMDRRYRLMSRLGVRNLAGYNQKLQEAVARGEPIADPFYKPEEAFDPAQPAPLLQPMPLLVVVIDELADLMMVAGKKVEELIARLAQKARAAGIHLILATQRPSVDVITGLIKANIPTRIAFQVSSRIDSRTILDQMGAEALLGHGDMLYLPPGTGLPTRVHGAFVADHEVLAVVAYLQSTGAPDYVEDILGGGAEEGEAQALGEREEGGETDPLYDQALHFVTKTRKASISGVQRKLRIGYNRAARLVEEMERAGVVGALQPNGAREVLAPAPPEDD